MITIDGLAGGGWVGRNVVMSPLISLLYTIGYN